MKASFEGLPTGIVVGVTIPMAPIFTWMSQDRFTKWYTQRHCKSHLHAYDTWVIIELFSRPEDRRFREVVHANGRSEFICEIWVKVEDDPVVVPVPVRYQ